MVDWGKDRTAPSAEVEQSLRLAFAIVQLLLPVDDAETIRAWWLGMEPALNDQSPALVLADDPDEVVAAALAFRAYG